MFSLWWTYGIGGVVIYSALVAGTGRWLLSVPLAVLFTALARLLRRD